MTAYLEHYVRERNKEHTGEATASAQKILEQLRRVMRGFNLKNHNISIVVYVDSATLVLKDKRTRRRCSATPPKSTELVCTLDVLQGIIEARENYWWVSKLPNHTSLTEEE